MDLSSTARPTNVYVVELCVGGTPCLAVFSRTELLPFKELLQDSSEGDIASIEVAIKDQKILNNLTAREDERQNQIDHLHFDLAQQQQYSKSYKEASLEAMTASVMFQRWLNDNIRSLIVVPLHIPGSLNVEIIETSKLLKSQVSESKGRPSKKVLLAQTMNKLQAIINGEQARGYLPMNPVTQPNGITVYKNNNECTVHKQIEGEHGEAVVKEMRRAWLEREITGNPTKGTEEVPWNFEHNRLMTLEDLTLRTLAAVVDGFKTKKKKKLGMNEEIGGDDEGNNYVRKINRVSRNLKALNEKVRPINKRKRSGCSC
jgi:hypothetical protein